jgi:hypothetical protein
LDKTNWIGWKMSKEDWTMKTTKLKKKNQNIFIIIMILSLVSIILTQEITSAVYSSGRNNVKQFF